MTSRKSAHLTVYSRASCHLCDDLLNALRPICDELGASIDVIDVEANPEFEGTYGERVPVVVGGAIELCHFFLDTATVRAYLLNFR